MVHSNSDQPIEGFIAKDNLVFAGNGIGFRNLLRAGKNQLEVHVKQVNSLNVFPIPDGDTGTNMLLTVQSAVEATESLPSHRVEVAANAAAQGALLGGRGNSGIILSQFLQGVAAGLAGREYFTAQDLAGALKLGADQAYRSVSAPVEGTILTVSRAAAEAAQKSATASQDIVFVWEELVRAAQLAVADTPELLAVLKQAGVVDSGGQGLFHILNGALRFLKQQPIEAGLNGNLNTPFLLSQESYGYDVQFVMSGHNLNAEQIRADFEAMGQSVLVVGRQNLLKVHLHVENPDIPLAYAARVGVIKDVVVEDMTQQAQRFGQQNSSVPVDSWPINHHSLEDSEISIVSLVSGAGLTEIFQSECIVLEDETVTLELLHQAIKNTNSDQILILPNKSDKISIAHQVEQIATKRVKTVPTITIPQGIAALLSFNRQADLETNARRMFEAAQQVRTIEVTTMVQTAVFAEQSVGAGAAVALRDGEFIAAGTHREQIVFEAAGQAGLENCEIITVYYGQQSLTEEIDRLAEKFAEHYPHLEFESYFGGQSLYNYIIALE